MPSSNETQKHDLTCGKCAHKTARVIACGRPVELCVSNETPIHYHCLETLPGGQGCDSNCGAEGTCTPLFDSEYQTKPVVIGEVC